MAPALVARRRRRSPYSAHAMPEGGISQVPCSQATAISSP